MAFLLKLEIKWSIEGLGKHSCELKKGQIETDCSRKSYSVMLGKAMFIKYIERKIRVTVRRQKSQRRTSLTPELKNCR